VRSLEVIAVSDVLADTAEVIEALTEASVNASSDLVASEDISTLDDDDEVDVGMKMGEAI